LWEDVRAALQIGYQAWVTRLPCFTKHLKRMLMSVDQTYCSFSLQFKMWVVLTGLCNFGDHYCGDHTNCSGFIWWGTCSLGDQFYQPTYQFVNTLAGGRGVRYNGMICMFFKLFGTSWVYSKYMEGHLWKCVDFTATTINESYFHWQAIFTPKWSSPKAAEYELSEAAAYITFCKRRADKSLGNRILQFNKNAPGLIGTAGQKNGKDESHILDSSNTL
jgi:hypothetical protein